MAETVAAFSLAVNILQILDLGAQFVGLAWNIWRSKDVDSLPIANLHLIAQNFKPASQELQIAMSSSPQSVEDKINGRIFTLAGECNKTAQQIIDSLNGIEFPDEINGNRRSKRKTFVSTFKILWKRDGIKELEIRLSSFKSEIMFLLAISLRRCMTQSLHNQDRILQQLDNLRNGNNELNTKMNTISNTQEGLGSILISYLTNRTNGASPVQLSNMLSDGLLSAVFDPEMPPIKDSIFNIPDSRRVALQMKFISKLRYDGMHDRELRISEAHQRTFRWIFESVGQERPWADFREWLESDQRLYWIAGKAGSGKSTLMKFISQRVAQGPSDHPDVTQEPRCKKHLLRWADGQPLVIATFYFWQAGSEMQKSKEGLYRSVLYQILRDSPEAISHISPERWESLCLYDNDPIPLTEIELRDALRKAITFVGSAKKLCLFIDGLDEFSGEHADLIKLVTDTTEASSVKICVSSRPWLVFEDPLKDKPSLMLEDLTLDDITKYVTSRFSSNRMFALLQTREATFAQDLINDIVRKADGVFLWVNLVVSSLLSGISHGDRVSDLQRRLNQLPSDLERLYDKILDDIGKFYLEHAAQFFCFMKSCPEPPEALLLSFADEEENLDFALNLPVQPLPKKEIRSRIEIMRRRLNSCCKGLIEIPKSALSGDYSSIEKVTVQYLHRSVKDYIEQPSVLKRLSKTIEKPFDPHLRLCSSALAMFKTHGDESHIFDRCEKLHKCMKFASKVSQVNTSGMIKILDELERTMPPDLLTLDYRIAMQRVLTQNYGLPTKECFGDGILSLAVKCNVLEYVRRRIKPGCLVQCGRELLRPVCPLALTPKRFTWNLLAGLRSNSDVGHTRIGTEWPLLLDATPSIFSNLDMVSSLLENGANPNFPITDGSRKTTIWIETLAFAIANIGTSPDPWNELLPLMVVHGARIDTPVLDRAIVVSAIYKGSEERIMPTARGLRKAFKSVKTGKSGFCFRLTDPINANQS